MPDNAIYTHDAEKSCCFTGHRKIDPKDYENITRKINSLVEELISNGIVHYYAGGAIGFDLVASVAIVNRKLFHPEVSLTLALPCKNHDAKWTDLERELFSRVVKRADRVVYVSEEYSRYCMSLRNRYMVDRSSVCICYLNSDRGGTASTVKYAAGKGLKIINIAEDEQLRLF